MNGVHKRIDHRVLNDARFTEHPVREDNLSRSAVEIVMSGNSKAIDEGLSINLLR